MQTQSWTDLSHEDRIATLRDFSDEEIVDRFLPQGTDADTFYRVLYEARTLWQPTNVAEARRRGGPPTKETVIGAWRDLNRSEAILELTDNSIDAWMRRRERYPNETASQLKIFIDVDSQTGTLRYEDNAGGVQEDNLENLVIPGYSETTDLARSIGSYKTGGKKAIFKLASEASIVTRYWNPVGTSDEAFLVQLTKEWLEHPTEYRFLYFPLVNRSVVERGQTVYTFKLREATKWTVEDVAVIIGDLRRIYTLLMVRHPDIQIYFNNRNTPILPSDTLYYLSGAHSADYDIRPQRVSFRTNLDWRGSTYEVEIEVVMGCRTTVALKREDDSFGIDLYGNDRLFVLQDQDEILRWLDLPAGQARMHARGYVNIIGPNVFVP